MDKEERLNGRPGFIHLFNLKKPPIKRMQLTKQNKPKQNIKHKTKHEVQDTKHRTQNGKISNNVSYDFNRKSRLKRKLSNF